MSKTRSTPAYRPFQVSLIVGSAFLPAVSNASMLVDVRTIDDETIMIHWLDGKAIYPDDGKGATAYMGHESRGEDTLKLFAPALDIPAASSVMPYTLKSTDDPSYFLPTSPVKCSRKSKVQGTAWNWPEPKWALEHTIFLHLPKKLVQSKTYELKIASSTGSDIASKSIKFDVFKNESEAIHVNLVGYNPQHKAMKSADLYMWMGDTGAKNYSKYEGRKVILFNTKNGQKQDVGSVKFWKKSGEDYGKWNLTRSQADCRSNQNKATPQQSSRSQDTPRCPFL